MLEAISDLLRVAPIWVGPIVAAVFFVVFRFLLPSLIPGPSAGVDPGTVLRPMFSTFARILPCAVLVFWVVAELSKLMDR
jgi:hypothetical protein